MNEDECVWTPSDSDAGDFFFDTACEEFGVYKEDDFRFCPFCGAPLRVSASPEGS